jgi:hypothetical protein
MTIKSKSAYLSARVTEKSRNKFHAKVKKLGKPSEILRELIDAFIEDRIIINPPVTSKEKLYVIGK